ncbi:MAG: hypothetical protein FJ207_13775 [Gemmatimonadetes bacterium]|nr:hypothetical protein [Gemmatimonadota bacterium]
MIRWSLLLALSAGLVAYAFWLYFRHEIAVPAARLLAGARAAALVLVLLLLFDVRLPTGAGGESDDWVLLDASLSMGAAAATGASAWEEASARARELERQGWRVVTFGDVAEPGTLDGEAQPQALASRLSPALDRAAEAGVRRVRVLSDFRLEDAVAVRSALAALPLQVELEPFGAELVNAGVSRLDVPDVARPSAPVAAEVEIHVASAVDSVALQVFEEGSVVADVRVAAPAPGLRARVPLELPPAGATGRVRYTARVSLTGDAFPSDDEGVAFASIGHEEGAVVLVSLRPDWEPRYLLPLLQDVTGLPALGYLRAGADRFIPMGGAADRGAPVDSATVRRAAGDATLFVLHGLTGDADAWARSLSRRTGRTVLFAADGVGAELAGIPSSEPRAGEWYVSGEVPMSAIAGSLAGASLQGLPPLTDVLLPVDPARVRGALLLQLRGTGTPEAALQLDERPSGRIAVVLASGFWRWAARDSGRDVYRRLWSGVAGWLLSGEGASPLEPRPTQWVVPRGEPVLWSAPVDSVPRRVIVTASDSTAGTVVVDAPLASQGMQSTGVLPPGAYAYRVEGASGDVLASGRFDVAHATDEMAPLAIVPDPAADEGLAPDAGEERSGSPLRTRSWPYLLVIGLLCAEWIGRRRSGLR